MLEKIQQLESKYRDLGPLYLREDKIQFKSLNQFIAEFVISYNAYYRTYLDKECTKSHCFAGKARTAGDIFRIVLSFDSNIKLEDVLTTLTDLVENYQSNEYHLDYYGIKTILCQDINKRVYSRKYSSRKYFSDPFWYNNQTFITSIRYDEFKMLPENYLELFNQSLANKAKGEIMIEESSSI